MEWYKQMCVNGEPQGMKGRETFFDKAQVDRRLAQMQGSTDELTTAMEDMTLRER